MHHAKNRGNKEIPLAILSRILAQSCVTLCLNYVGERIMVSGPASGAVGRLKNKKKKMMTKSRFCRFP